MKTIEELGEMYCDLRDGGATLGAIAVWVADDVYACQTGADREKVLRAYALLREAALLLDEAGITRP